MCNAIPIMSTQPSQRLSVVTDLYRLLLDRFSVLFLVVFFISFVDPEALLNSNRGVLRALNSEGLQHILGDIITTDSDPLLLV